MMVSDFHQWIVTELTNMGVRKKLLSRGDFFGQMAGIEKNYIKSPKSPKREPLTIWK
jgi:hypothetical protein